MQKWLWACWQDFWNEYVPNIVGNDPFAVCVNGDLVDGNHHRTVELIAIGEDDHLRVAIDTLEPVSKKARFLFITEGTEVHTKRHENAIGRAIGAYRNPETGGHVFHALFLNIHGCPGVARHHITTTSRPYLEASQFSINMGVERIESHRSGHVLPRWFARAHRHRVGGFYDAAGLMVITPAWQANTRYTRKVVPASLPNPGGIILDWRHQPEGALPIVHPPKVYKPKQPAYVTL